MTLSHFASNIYSYAGEDGILEEILRLLGLRNGLCVEFGAGDGVESSNTKALRDRNWRALLVEADGALFQRLNERFDSDQVETWKGFVRPTGETSIDALLRGRRAQVMSIDVDGDDFFIWAEMNAHPDVVIIEYNQTVPWFLDVRAAQLGNRFGASALSLYRLGRLKGYFLAAATETNLIFVLEHHDQWMPPGFRGSYELIMQELPLRCGVTITNYSTDRYELNMGNLPRWGWRSKKPLDELVVGDPLYPAMSAAISKRCADELEPLL